VRIDRVVRGTPADLAGLRRGDIVTEVDDRPIQDADGLVLAVGRLRPEQTVRLTVLRGDNRQRLVSKLTKQRIVGRTIATHRPPSWRGIRVDYPTAVLPIQQLFEVPSGCVAIAEVERDSPAAKHGLQQGMLIREVAGQPVETPERFTRAVAGRTGRVELVRIDAGRDRKVLLDAE
jgi:S1-C subfamily serine protease